MPNKARGSKRPLASLTARACQRFPDPGTSRVTGRVQLRQSPQKWGIERGNCRPEARRNPGVLGGATHPVRSVVNHPTSPWPSLQGASVLSVGYGACVL